jgi:predicted amidophosphoribosyltransferase
MRHCQYCGGEISNHDNHCHHCGSHVGHHESHHDSHHDSHHEDHGHNEHYESPVHEALDEIFGNHDDHCDD